MRSNDVLKIKAPWHLWVVGIVSLLWNAIGAFDFIMTQTQNEAYMGAFTEAQLEFFYGFPMWLNIAWGMAVFAGVLGSLVLLFRCKWSFALFVTSWVAMLITTIHNYGFSNAMEVIGGVGSLIFSAVIFIIALLLVWYAWAMQKRGVLR